MTFDVLKFAFAELLGPAGFRVGLAENGGLRPKSEELCKSTRLIPQDFEGMAQVSKTCTVDGPSVKVHLDACVMPWKILRRQPHH